MIPSSPLFRHRTFWMASRHPCDSPLGVSDNIGKSLGRDGEQPNPLVRRVRKIMQPLPGLQGSTRHSGRKLLLAHRSAHGRSTGEHEEHLLDAVMHVQRASCRALATAPCRELRGRPLQVGVRTNERASESPSTSSQGRRPGSAVHGSSVSRRRLWRVNRARGRARWGELAFRRRRCRLSRHLR